ncbi:TrkH family potassium uptake protein [Eubacterium sp. am_0171]|uniref:TrkH family potassium uptake protein n=1 Tax=unclassified Eubacterium (in: firmicutes) TaxID=2624479 RepID=UPI00101F26B2|nr:MULTISPECIES: TrkH family potassium uptake protein [unclassified Eubacterium (in: firmicutes)]MSC84840.1 TrkH family potassium uptake protein [Eubacterium sp. BIOML-A1]MSD07463.1 TrkH family potassium uptake protein [Eubacterium sp. BIOML-A2]RYT14938.1 TrkH family potassium uptake protein [Eubacterium sp. am_0171]
MNYRMTTFIIGKMLGVEGALLLLPAAVAFLYGEKSGLSFLMVSAVLLIIFLIFGRKKPGNKLIYGKEGLVIVGSAWILWSLFGALPFFISGCIPNYLDAFFETVSGFTTTGSTILTNIEALPMGMAFWRSLTHWIGGMGVLVFVMMLTSLDDESSMHLMRAEVPGPEADKLVPKARSTAKILYSMYFVLTAAEVVFLLFGGMSFYDALIHSFSTAGTGGFSNRNASIAYYDSAYIDGVITVFMILFGVNFNIYFLLRLKNWKAALKNEELRGYLGIILASMAVITLNIMGMYGNILHAFRYASFQVGAIITTTGFCTANFDQWPELSKVILLGLMVIGACAGSTGGGIKVSRFLILMKSVKQEIRRMLHPKSVTIVQINGKKVGRDTMHGVYIYFICYILIMMLSVLLVSINDYDFTTTFSSVLTTLNNVGPGLAQVGPIENFSGFSPLSKIVFCLDMLIGRLEIFPYLLLLSPDLWRRRF